MNNQAYSKYNQQQLKDTKQLVELYQQPKVRLLIDRLLDNKAPVVFKGRPLNFYGAMVAFQARRQPGLGEKYKQLFFSTKKNKSQFKTLLQRSYQDEKKFGFLKKAIAENQAALPAKLQTGYRQKEEEWESIKEADKEKEGLQWTEKTTKLIYQAMEEKGVFEQPTAAAPYPPPPHPLPEQLSDERVKEVLKTFEPPKTQPKEIKFPDKSHPKYSSPEEIKRAQMLREVRQEPPPKPVDITGKPLPSSSPPSFTPAKITPARAGAAVMITTIRSQIIKLPARAQNLAQRTFPVIKKIVFSPAVQNLALKGQIATKKFISRHGPLLAGGGAGMAGGFIAAGPPGAVLGGAVGAAAGQVVSQAGSRTSFSGPGATMDDYGEDYDEEVMMPESPGYNQGIMESGEGESGGPGGAGIALFPARTVLIGAFLGLGIFAFLIILFGEGGGGLGGPAQGAPAPSGTITPSPSFPTLPPPPPIGGLALSCPLGNNITVTCGTFDKPINGCGHGNPQYGYQKCTSPPYASCPNGDFTDQLKQAIDVDLTGASSANAPVSIPLINGSTTPEWTLEEGPTPITSEWGYKAVYKTNYNGHTLRLDLTHINPSIKQPTAKSGETVATVHPGVDGARTDGTTLQHLHTAIQIDGIWTNPGQVSMCL